MLVETDLENGVATVTLNDPDRRNVFTSDLVSGIVGVFDWLEREADCGAVVITGAGPAFCAGADLSELGTATQDNLREIYQGFLRVKNSTLPTVAAVNGAAVGAGMNLALACDVRIMGESGRFDTRFVKLGIHPGGGHTWMLRQLAGPQTTAAMVLFGQVVGGQGAVQLGLAWQCVPDDQLLATARHFASRAAEAPRELIKRIKETIDDMIPVDIHEEAVDKELTYQVLSMNDPEFKARILAMRDEIRRRS